MAFRAPIGLVFFLVVETVKAETAHRSQQSPQAPIMMLLRPASAPLTTVPASVASA